MVNVTCGSFAPAFAAAGIRGAGACRSAGL